MTDKELMQQALDFICSVMVHPSQIAARDAIADALEKKLAQPEQEPVAWIDAFGNVFPLGAQRGPKHLNEPMKPLYTTPPQRKPLTDEEIKMMIPDGEEWKYGVGFSEAISFARAIEAAHGIKEKNT